MASPAIILGDSKMKSIFSRLIFHILTLKRLYLKLFIKHELKVTSSPRYGVFNGMELRSYFPYVVPASMTSLALPERAGRGDVSTGV